MAEELSELEQAALQNNVGELIGLRAKPGREAAERALALASDSVGLLFKGSPEPVDEAGILAKAAGEARYSAGPMIRIWGQEGHWNVWIDGSEVGSTPDQDPETKRALIQQACDAGLREQSGKIAGEIATTDVNKARVETRLLQLAGANDLSQPSEKADVLTVRLGELHKIETKARYWTITNQTNFDNTPEMVAISMATNKARSQIINSI